MDYTNQGLRDQWEAAVRNGWEEEAQRMAQRRRNRVSLIRLETRIQQQIDAIRADYDARIAKLEERIAWLEREGRTT